MERRKYIEMLSEERYREREREREREKKINIKYI